MSIDNPEDLTAMRNAGSVVRLMLQAMEHAVQPGITTAELDEAGAAVMRQHERARRHRWFTTSLEPVA